MSSLHSLPLVLKPGVEAHGAGLRLQPLMLTAANPHSPNDVVKSTGLDTSCMLTQGFLQV